MDAFRQDVLHALRVMNRNRGFSAVAIATLALGIGTTAGVFALVDAALRGPAGVAEPGRLVTIEEVVNDGETRAVFSYRQYVEHRERALPYSSLAAHQLDELSYRGEAGAEVVLAVNASDNYFETLGLRPAMGRLFNAADAADGAVVVLGHDFWRVRLASDPGVLGRTLVLNGQPLTVIGVLPPGFRGTFIGLSPAAWVPIGMYARLHPGAAVMDGDRFGWLQLFGRLADGVSRRQAEAATSAAARAIGASDGAAREMRGARVRRLTGLPTGPRAAVTGFLGLLLGTAALVLVIASINVAGMLLARATDRRREIALRVALGAGRARLVRQLLTEMIVLFGAGAACGVLLAAWVADMLNRFHPPLPITLELDLGVDARVLAFSLLATLMTGVLFGLAPAAHALGLDPMRAIRDGMDGGARRRARSVLVSAQFSVSLVLLVTAALFARAVATSAAADPGFDGAGVAVAGIDLEPHGYDDAGQRAWYDALLLRLRARQDVETAGLAKVVPLGPSRSSTFVVVAGSDRAPPDRPANVQYNVIDAGYLDALRLRVVAGRTFGAADDARAVRVALVNETFARTFWPEPAAAVGGTVREDGVAIRVVGVVADSRYRALREPATPQLYLPFSQRGGAATSVFVRARSDAHTALAALRREVAALDRDVPLIDAQPLDDVVALSVFPQRLAATLIGIFGALGLALAAVGIYGVMSYTVARSTREIGIRMALGAERGRVHRSVTLHALRLAGIGAVAGCAIALPGARVLAGLLHGVSPGDPVAFGGVAVLLGAVALLAAYLPARRAASIEPGVALRQE